MHLTMLKKMAVFVQKQNTHTQEHRYVYVMSHFTLYKPVATFFFVLHFFLSMLYFFFIQKNLELYKYVIQNKTKKFLKKIKTSTLTLQHTTTKRNPHKTNKHTHTHTHTHTYTNNKTN